MTLRAFSIRFSFLPFLLAKAVGRSTTLQSVWSRTPLSFLEMRALMIPLRSETLHPGRRRLESAMLYHGFKVSLSAPSTRRSERMLLQFESISKRFLCNYFYRMGLGAQLKFFQCLLIPYGFKRAGYRASDECTRDGYEYGVELRRESLRLGLKLMFERQVFGAAGRAGLLKMPDEAQSKIQFYHTVFLGKRFSLEIDLFASRYEREKPRRTFSTLFGIYWKFSRQAYFFVLLGHAYRLDLGFKFSNEGPVKGQEKDQNAALGQHEKIWLTPFIGGSIAKELDVIQLDIKNAKPIKRTRNGPEKSKSKSEKMASKKTVDSRSRIEASVEKIDDDPSCLPKIIRAKKKSKTNLESKGRGAISGQKHPASEPLSTPPLRTLLRQVREASMRKRQSKKDASISKGMASLSL